MPPSTALRILPTGKHPDEDRDAPQTVASLLTPSLEDLHLAERVERALSATGNPALRAMEVIVNARIVRLVGRVSSYYMKQISQETAFAVPGGHQVRNDIEVVSRK